MLYWVYGPSTWRQWSNLKLVTVKTPKSLEKSFKTTTSRESDLSSKGMVIRSLSLSPRKEKSKLLSANSIGLVKFGEWSATINCFRHINKWEMEWWMKLEIRWGFLWLVWSKSILMPQFLKWRKLGLIWSISFKLKTKMPLLRLVSSMRMTTIQEHLLVLTIHHIQP